MPGPLMLDLAATQLTPSEREAVLHPLVGGVILFSRNFSSVSQLADLVQTIRAMRAELLIAADTEGGRVQRFREGFLRLPAVARYGARYQREAVSACRLARLGGWLLGAELRALDLDLAFTPVLDLDGGVSTVIGDRAFADSAQAVADLAASHAQGLRAAGMAATGKHFPGHGFVVPDSHLELPVDERSLDDILAVDLAPYRRLIAEGLESVMVAHVRYARVDPWPASISAYWIGQQLRKGLGFTGAVFSDDLSMGGLARFGNVHARFRAALDAGCDMVPVCNQPQDVAALLAADAPDWNPELGHRLARLRGRGPASGLDVLRQSEEYQLASQSLQQMMKVTI